MGRGRDRPSMPRVNVQYTAHHLLPERASDSWDKLIGASPDN